MARQKATFNHGLLGLTPGGELPDSARRSVRPDPKKQILRDIAYDYLLAVHGTPRTRPSAVTLLASRDAALAAFAVRVGVHGLCRVVDAPTGVATASHVNRIAYHVASPTEVRLTLDLAYTDQTGMDVWILGMSRLDVNTRLDWG